MEEQKTAEQISLEIVGPLPVPGQRKWAAGLSKQDLIIKAMQVYADQQNAALKAALAELIEGSEVFRKSFIVAVGEASPYARMSLIQIDRPLDRARKLLDKPNDSAQDHPTGSSDQ